MGLSEAETNKALQFVHGDAIDGIIESWRMLLITITAAPSASGYRRAPSCAGNPCEA
jgi:hypothetical protein